ncbi:MAG: hypothetical protein JW969_06985 [Spirochaetales bacterium]|nr:hypothetical protein [Spirochaetales bacterium]
MFDATITNDGKTLRLKITGDGKPEETDTIKRTLLINMPSNEHVIIDAVQADNPDISFFQVIISAYLALKQEKITKSLPMECFGKMDNFPLTGDISLAFEVIEIETMVN